MYFRDRAEAGTLLADKLMAYEYSNVAVVALSPGGVLVGEQIARRLHAPLSLLVTQRITAPGEPSLVLGTIDQEGGFLFNQMIAAGQMEEYMEDARTFVEEEKLRKFYEMTGVVGRYGATDPEQLAGRTIIIATDGVKNGMSFDAALHFLSTIHTERIIGAVPVGPAPVIERLTERLDEIHYLYIPENFLSVSHYYEDKRPFDEDVIRAAINEGSGRWD